MERKPKISPNHTFVFDEEDIEALDELSMTAVIGEVTDSIRNKERATREPAPPEQPAPAAARPAQPPAFDPEIAALMREINKDD